MAKKISNDKNSLEQLLIRGKDGLAQNKAKAFQFIFVFVVVFVAIWGARSFFSGVNSELTDADAARASAQTPQDLVDAAANFKGDTAAALYLDAGEMFLAQGQEEIMRKKANSRAAENDPEAAALNPSVAFNEAAKAFETAFGLGSADLKARAAFGVGSAQEALASVAADDAAVDAALEAAKAQYAKVAEVCAKSPYCESAAARLAALNRAVAADYWKTTAKAFRELPTPPEKAESILPGDGELTPGQTTDVGEFGLNDDETPATEEAAPATDAPAADAAPATDAPAADAPAAEATPAE